MSQNTSGLDIVRKALSKGAAIQTTRVEPQKAWWVNMQIASYQFPSSCGK